MTFDDFTRITDASKCIGKTITKAIWSSDDLGFVFSDKTYFFCEVDGDGDGAIDTDCCSPDLDTALALGLIDQAGFERLAKQQKADREKHQRAQYEALKAKFEPKPGSQS